MPKDWSYQAIKAVGNYGEIFDRNVGAGSPMKIKRGLNSLWNKGGILVCAAGALNSERDVAARTKAPSPGRLRRPPSPLS